ncbi:hypothetical protein [Hydrogenophaga sp.]|uniref:hypothetical protein n=1 Tax=Hydrogenophaga sp. TaxID=1904254 RepID=UPI003F712BA0
MQDQTPPDHMDEEYHLPSVEALLAGTLALMTGYAQSARDCPHRALMADKLVSNLFCLSGHPQLSVPMQTMLANLRTRWQVELEHSANGAEVAGRPTALWHAVPASVQ